ncbi:PilW family protein [Kineococcus sp. SYSU DK001]|uniref:PilW family protein n=1 Tax=Kineococcus sp. SYSU DK001 TaxID=3383122 RepID=UPI003D7CBCE9
MNALRRRIRRSRESGDAGITLGELSVTMLIMGILISVVAVVVVQSYRLQRSTITRENDTTDVQIAMDTVSRSLRMASYLQDPSAAATITDPPKLAAFTEVAADAVTFTATVGARPNPALPGAAADPVRLTYRLSGGVLSETTIKPLVAGKGLKSTYGTVGTTRVIARNVVSSSSQPLFTYLYEQPDKKISTTVPSGNAALAIRQVRVNLTVDSDGSGPLQGTTFTSTVVNQNLD